MRRWVRWRGVTSHFVEWQGAPIKSVKTGFKHAVKIAGLWGKVTPHTLRHTAATWLMQRGVPIWQAAGYLGMSAEMIERTYGHHHPDYMRAAAQAITSKQSQNVSLVIPLVKPEPGPAKRQKT
jgi:integrase